jgi:flagellar FliL protein
MADDKEGIGPEAENQPPAQSDAQKKASLDRGTITAPSNRSVQKVELDLDDAVFLDEEDDVEEIEEKPPKPEKKKPAKKPKKSDREPFSFQKNKRFLFVGIALLLAGAVLIWWFFLKPKPQITPVPPQQEETVSRQPEKESSELTENVISFEPFWLEFDVNGTYRFLTCRFTFPVKGDLLKTEVDSKRIIIRDAVYYYFKNKDIVFLGNTDNADKLKSDLLAIINQYLGNGQLQEILIQEYRIE